MEMRNLDNLGLPKCEKIYNILAMIIWEHFCSPIWNNSAYVYCPIRNKNPSPAKTPQNNYIINSVFKTLQIKHQRQ